MKRKIVLIVSIFLFSILTYGQLPKITFTPHWLPQAQFAGYYVAQEKGFYEQAGIDVEIIHPSASVNAVEFLANGKADIISLFLITAINNREKGLDLVNIAQLSQKSAILFVSKKSTGIESLNDFNGKKIGIWMSGFKEIPQALIQDHNLHVEWVPILSTINLFLVGGVDLLTVMWYNEYDQIYLSGINYDEMNTFFLSEYGYDIPEDGLYTLQKTFETQGSDLKAFVEASQRGWEFAAQNKEYTIDLVVQLMCELNIPSNRAHQRWMLDKVLELQDVKKKNIQPTMLLPEDFNKALHIIKNQNKTEIHFEYDDFFHPVLPIKP